MFIVTVIVIIFVVDTAGAVKTTVEDIAALRARYLTAQSQHKGHVQEPHWPRCAARSKVAYRVHS